MTEGEVLYNVAAGLGFVAYLLTNVFWLRVLLVIGACVYVVAGVNLGLTSMIGWHVAYALINLGHVIILFLDHHATTLPEPARTLYSEKFSSIKPREFKRIVNLKNELSISNGQLLRQGDENQNLYLITEGEALIAQDDTEITTLGKGDFFGEMSLLSGRPVAADVETKKGLKYLCWSKQELASLERKNLSLYNRFMMVVGLNVIDKLRETTNLRRLTM